jgi:hypothetical protein
MKINKILMVMMFLNSCGKDDSDEEHTESPEDKRRGCIAYAELSITNQLFGIAIRDGYRAAKQCQAKIKLEGEKK